jgi:hypothetical protein
MGLNRTKSSQKLEDPYPTITAGILQYSPIQSAILRNLIGQIFATELENIVKCPH